MNRFSNFISEKKCPDGKCRKDCVDIRHSACDFDSPLRCPDGRCVTMLVQCASVKCPADYPFLCPDNSCKGEISQCSALLSGKIVKKITTKTNDKVQTINLNDQSDKSVGYLEVKESFSLFIEGISLSQLSKASLTYDNRYRRIYNDFFSKDAKDLQLRDFFRSAIVNIVTSGNSDIMTNYNSPIKLFLNFDELVPISKLKKLPIYVA